MSTTRPAKIRLLAEPIYVKKFEGGAERKDAAYFEVREDLSTVPTYKLQTEIVLCKKSIRCYRLKDDEYICGNLLNDHPPPPQLA